MDNIEQIKNILKTEGNNRIEIGRLLKEIRDNSKYGTWEKKVTLETGLTKTTAYRYIKVYELTQKVATLQDLDFSKLIELCKLDNEQLNDLIEKYSIEDLQDMSVREFKKIIKEYLPTKEKKEKEEPSEDDIPEDEDLEGMTPKERLAYLKGKKDGYTEAMSSGFSDVENAQCNTDVKKDINKLSIILHPDKNGQEIDRNEIMVILNSVRAKLNL